MQLAICILLATAGEIFFKLGAAETARVDSSWSWTGVTGLRSQWVWWGVIVSVVSLFNWLAAIKKLPLTVAFPIGNAVHILVPLACWLFLSEKISPVRWAGILLVLSGLAVMAKPAAKLEERL
jgi:drug/metabolite transporter (DMT)-like permease